MPVSYAISKFKMFGMVFSPVNLNNCFQPPWACAGRGRGLGPAESADGLRARLSEVENENWKLNGLLKVKWVTWSGIKLDAVGMLLCGIPSCHGWCFRLFHSHLRAIRVGIGWPYGTRQVNWRPSPEW